MSHGSQELDRALPMFFTELHEMVSLWSQVRSEREERRGSKQLSLDPEEKQRFYLAVS